MTVQFNWNLTRHQTDSAQKIESGENKKNIKRQQKTITKFWQDKKACVWHFANDQNMYENERELFTTNWNYLNTMYHWWVWISRKKKTKLLIFITEKKVICFTLNRSKLKHYAKTAKWKWKKQIEAAGYGGWWIIP